MKRLIKPAVLYKYLDPGGIVVLASSTIRFTPPLELNDPFESRLPVMTRLQNRSSGRRRAVFPEDQELVLKEIGKTYGVTCFSAVRDSLLMWAHYASAHSGIVIGFKTEHAAFTGFGNLMPVQYFCKRPIVPLTEPNELLLRMLTTKSQDWTYEQEWRVTSMLGDCTQEDKLYLKSFDPECIETVILGARTDDTLKKQVINWSAEHPRARILQARLHSLRFGLHFDENLDIGPPVIVGPERHIPVGFDLPFCSRLEMRDGVLTIRDETAEVILDPKLRSLVQAGVKAHAQSRIVVYPSDKEREPSASEKPRQRRTGRPRTRASDTTK